jgi:hypothetical protein
MQVVHRPPRSQLSWFAWDQAAGQLCKRLLHAPGAVAGFHRWSPCCHVLGMVLVHCFYGSFVDYLGLVFEKHTV